MVRRARLFVACLVVALAAAGCTDGGGSAIPGGAEDALQLDYDTFDGDEATLASYEGQPLVVNFWASWCTPCITEMPDLEAVHRSVDGQVAFVGLSTDFTQSEARSMAEKTGVTYDLGYDRNERIVREFVTVGLPVTVFVRADGTIARVHNGPITREKLENLIRDELGVETG